MTRVQERADFFLIPTLRAKYRITRIVQNGLRSFWVWDFVKTSRRLSR